MTQDLYTEHLRAVAKQRRAREKRHDHAADMVSAAMAAAGGAFIDGFWLMLAVGVAHAEWVPKLPTIGYWWAVLLVAMLRGVFSNIQPRKRKTE
jgi:hypothetical protein